MPIRPVTPCMMMPIRRSAMIHLPRRPMRAGTMARPGRLDQTPAPLGSGDFSN